MPRFKTIINTGAEYGTITVRAATALVAGQAVGWEMDGTEDGLSVDDTDATGAGLVAGIVPAAIAAGAKGEAICYGLCTNALILRNGVTATNDTLDIGDILDLTSASSCLDGRKIAGPILANTFAATNNAAATVLPPMFVLCQTFASYATSDVTTNAKVFVRCM